MEYDENQHSMKCPKCGHGMDVITYGGDVEIDRCTNCQGIWFDIGEADVLKGKWMGDALDIGVADIDCGDQIGEHCVQIEHTR